MPAATRSEYTDQSVDKLGRLNSLELLINHSLGIVGYGEFDAEPCGERYAFVHPPLPEPCPCHLGPMPRIQPTKSERLDEWSRTMIQTAHRSDTLLYPEHLRIRGEPFKRTSPKRVEFRGPSFQKILQVQVMGRAERRRCLSTGFELLHDPLPLRQTPSLPFHDHAPQNQPRYAIPSPHR
jgi:hypothetical protein